MGFSITSAVLGAVIISNYSLNIFYITREDIFYPQLAMHICVLLLGIIEFIIGIWAPICCCLMLPCSGGCCCKAVPQHQVRISERGLGGGGGGVGR